MTTEDLLTPIPGDNPAGHDLIETAEWQAIREARRADAGGNLGRWERDRKESNWYAVLELTTSALGQRSKDLRLGVWFLEGSIRLHGMQGLRHGLHFLRVLITDFWDRGLYPEPDYRATPLEWLGEELAAAIRLIPITARADGQTDYSWSDRLIARSIGYERDLTGPDGASNDARRKRRQLALNSGQPSAEMFDSAVRATRRAGLEQLAADVESSISELRALQTLLEERLGSDTPRLQEPLEVLSEIQDFFQDPLKARRLEEPDYSEPARVERAPAPPAPNIAPAVTIAAHPSLPALPASSDAWATAEAMARNGEVQQGLSEMARLASLEHGRSRFLRKLALAEICQPMKRDRLVVSILEELAWEIENLHLDQWESPSLIGRVWGALYRQYRVSPNSDQAARATMLFDKLCRLDPWQALQWEE